MEQIYCFAPTPQDPSSPEVAEWGETVSFEVLKERAATLDRTRLAQVLEPLSLWARARVMAALGDLENADHYFHRALETNPPDERTTLTAAWNLIRLRKALPKEDHSRRAA